MTVCGEADNIRHTRDKIAECKPHLLVIALRLGTGDSLEFVKALKAQSPGLLILVYSAFISARSGGAEEKYCPTNTWSD